MWVGVVEMAGYICDDDIYQRNGAGVLDVRIRVILAYL